MTVAKTNRSRWEIKNAILGQLNAVKSMSRPELTRKVQLGNYQSKLEIGELLYEGFIEGRGGTLQITSLGKAWLVWFNEEPRKTPA